MTGPRRADFPVGVSVMFFVPATRSNLFNIHEATQPPRPSLLLSISLTMLAIPLQFTPSDSGNTRHCNLP